MSHPPITLPRLIPVPPRPLFLPPSHRPTSPTYRLSCTSRELSCLTCCLSRSSSTLDLFFVHCLFRSALFAACLALLASYPVQLAGRPVKQDACPVTPSACLVLPLPTYVFYTTQRSFVPSDVHLNLFDSCLDLLVACVALSANHSAPLVGYPVLLASHTLILPVPPAKCPTLPINWLVLLDTVRLSSNDHPKSSGLASQLLVFKTKSFKVECSLLGFKGLHTIIGCVISPNEVKL